MSEPDTGVWMTVSELALQRAVSKQSLSERIARLEARGASFTRPGPGRTKMVNVAQFIRAAGENADPVREGNGARTAVIPASPDAPEALVYAREQARNTAIRADLAQLEFDERTGKVVPAEDVAAAQAQIFAAAARGLDQLLARCDDGAAAVAREGEHGLRVFMRAEIIRVRAAMERELRNLAADAQAADKAAQ